MISSKDKKRLEQKERLTDIEVSLKEGTQDVDLTERYGSSATEGVVTIKAGGLHHVLTPSENIRSAAISSLRFDEDLGEIMNQPRKSNGNILTLSDTKDGWQT